MINFISKINFKDKFHFKESVLIAVGFYIGVNLEYGGALPFIIVAGITVLAMITSEVGGLD